MTDSTYAPPPSGFYMQKPTSPGIWRILGILIAIANIVVFLAVGSLDSPEPGESGSAYSAGYVTGYAIAGILWPAVIALLFRIGKSFRNPRSTWKVFFFVSVFFLVGGLGNVAMKGVAKLDAAGTVDATSVEFLQKVAGNAKENLPMMADEETEWYDVTASEALLTYHYRMVNYSAEELDADAFIEIVKAEGIPKLCSDRGTRDELLEKGVTLRFAYTGNDDVLIASFDATAADCGP